MKTIRVPILVSVQDVIEAEQPPLQQSCDWLDDPLAFGIMIFPLKVYETIRRLRDGNPSS